MEGDYWGGRVGDEWVKKFTGVVKGTEGEERTRRRTDGCMNVLHTIDRGYCVCWHRPDQYHTFST